MSQQGERLTGRTTSRNQDPPLSSGENAADLEM